MGCVYPRQWHTLPRVRGSGAGEVSAKHSHESQGEERISSCRSRRDDELSISRGVLATVVAGGIITEWTDARVTVISSVVAITCVSLDMGTICTDRPRLSCGDSDLDHCIR